MKASIALGIASIGSFTTTDFMFVALTLGNIGNVYHCVVDTDIAMKNPKLFKKYHMCCGHY